MYYYYCYMTVDMISQFYSLLVCVLCLKITLTLV